MSQVRGFAFLELPREIRDKIYSYLLIHNFNEDDAAKEDKIVHDSKVPDNEHDSESSDEEGDYKLEAYEEGRRVDPTFSDCYELHTAIMFTNHQIHDEAAAVLYGENVFTWAVYGVEATKLWQQGGHDKPKLPDRYTRLITKLYLEVNFQSDEGVLTSEGMYAGFSMARTNLGRACKKLARNPVMKEVTVNFLNKYTGGPFMARMGLSRFPGNPYKGEKILEPLKLLRGVRNVKFRGHASPAYVADLTKVMTGPRADGVVFGDETEYEEEDDYDYDDDDDQEDHNEM